jgi:hypothetical protein
LQKYLIFALEGIKNAKYNKWNAKMIKIRPLPMFELPFGATHPHPNIRQPKKLNFVETEFMPDAVS